MSFRGSNHHVVPPPSPRVSETTSCSAFALSFQEVCSCSVQAVHGPSSARSRRPARRRASSAARPAAAKAQARPRECEAASRVIRRPASASRCPSMSKHALWLSKHAAKHKPQPASRRRCARAAWQLSRSAACALASPVCGTGTDGRGGGAGRRCGAAGLAAKVVLLALALNLDELDRALPRHEAHLDGAHATLQGLVTGRAAGRRHAPQHERGASRGRHVAAMGRGGQHGGEEPVCARRVPCARHVRPLCSARARAVQGEGPEGGPWSGSPRFSWRVGPPCS